MPRRGRGGGTAVSRSYAQASPSVAARQLPLGGAISDPLPNFAPEGEMPRRGRGGDRPASPLFAQLRASSSVAARQLPLGGSYGKSDSADRIEWPTESGGHPEPRSAPTRKDSHCGAVVVRSPHPDLVQRIRSVRRRKREAGANHTTEVVGAPAPTGPREGGSAVVAKRRPGPVRECGHGLHPRRRGRRSCRRRFGRCRRSRRSLRSPSRAAWC